MFPFHFPLISESWAQRQKQLQREFGGARAAKAKLNRKMKILDSKDEKVESQKQQNLEAKQQLRKERIEQGIVWQQMLVKGHFQCVTSACFSENWIMDTRAKLSEEGRRLTEMELSLNRRHEFQTVVCKN